MKLVIIGSGPGGIAAATTAKAFARDTEVMIITDEETEPHRRPGVALALEHPKTELLQIADWSFNQLEKKGIIIHRGTRVVDCDPEAKTVTIDRNGSSKAIDFDKLIIATGGTPIVPPVKGKDLPSVLTIKNLADIQSIAEQLSSINAIVVVGAGFSGLEMAEKFHELGKDVHLVVRSRILRALIEEELSTEVKVRIPTSVHVHVGESLSSINGDDRVRSVTIADEEVHADAVVCMTGVRPNVDLAKQLGLEIGPNGGVLVNRVMQTSSPDIYAVGDCAELTDSNTGKTFLLPVASMAARAGRQAGVSAIGRDRVYDDLNIRYQYDYIFSTEIISVGLSSTHARAFGISAQVHYLEDPAEYAKIALVIDTNGKIIGGQVVSARMGSPIAYQIYERVRQGAIVSDQLLLEPRYDRVRALLESTFGPIRSLED